MKTGKKNMDTGEIITAVVSFALAGVLLILGIRHFLERGFLLNNAYIYESKREKETMDKNPFYRQSAIVFYFLSVVFFIVGLYVVIQNCVILLIEIPVMTVAIVYAVVSTVRMNKQGRNSMAMRWITIIVSERI